MPRPLLEAHSIFDIFPSKAWGQGLIFTFILDETGMVHNNSLFVWQTSNYSRGKSNLRNNIFMIILERSTSIVTLYFCSHIIIKKTYFTWLRKRLYSSRLMQFLFSVFWEFLLGKTCVIYKPVINWFAIKIAICIANQMPGFFVILVMDWKVFINIL